MLTVIMCWKTRIFSLLNCYNSLKFRRRLLANLDKAVGSIFLNEAKRLGDKFKSVRE